MKCIFIARFEVNEKRTRTKKKKKKRKISQSSVKNKKTNSIHDLASNARAKSLWPTDPFTMHLKPTLIQCELQFCLESIFSLSITDSYFL